MFRARTYLLVSYFILLLQLSCSNAPSVDIPDNEAVQRNHLWDLVKSKKLDTTTLRPFNFSLMGMLGDESIEMFLFYDPKDIYEDPNCLAVQGDFNYTDRQSSMQKLNGTLCFDTGITTLYTSKESINPSTFRGIFRGQVFDFKGKWSTNNGTQEARFSLDNQVHAIDEQSLQKFAQKIDEHLQKSSYLQLSHVGYDELGIYLKDLQENQLEIKKFSPTNLKWMSWNDDQQSNYFYQESIDMWHYNKSQQFVIIMHATEVKLKGTQTVEVEKTSVWAWQDSSFVDIFIELPSRLQKNSPDLFARIQDNRLQLVQKQNHQIWEWAL